MFLMYQLGYAGPQIQMQMEEILIQECLQSAWEEQWWRDIYIVEDDEIIAAVLSLEHRDSDPVRSTSGIIRVTWPQTGEVDRYSVAYQYDIAGKYTGTAIEKLATDNGRLTTDKVSA